MKILIIGGPDNISSGTINAFEKSRKEFAVFTLPETIALNNDNKFRFYKGNRDDIVALKNALDDYKPEVVIDFVCFNRVQCEGICNMLQGKVKQYILVSTVDVYGYPLTRLPMPETGTFVAPVTEYAKNKLECEHVLSGFKDLPFTIARPSYSMGNSFVLSPLSHIGGQQLIYRLRNGLPVFSPGDGTTLLHASIAHNTGAMIAALAGSEKAIGKAYNCAHEHFITHDMYINLFADILNVKPDIVHIPTDFISKHFPEQIKHTMLGFLTRYNLAFDIQQFKDDFPFFKWELSHRDFICNYVSFCDKNNLLANNKSPILDDEIISLWYEKGN